MKTILVPLDLSPGSRRVCVAAARLARVHRARLVLLNVAVPPGVELRAYGFAAAQVLGMMAVLEKRRARELLALGRYCRQHGARVRAEQITGRAVPAILALARKLRAEYIVMGSHSHGAAFDLFVGSVTQGVLRGAPCPVLIIPMRAP